MTNSFKMAEMVNQANYAAMSYNELVTLNFAFLLAVGEIKPLMMKKRAEEMDSHTDEYVAKMNNYGASKAEIMNCLEKKAMRETPYGTSDHRDVDDQTPKEEKDNQDKGEDVLALPEPSQTTMTEIMETEPAEASKDEDRNKDVTLDNHSEGDANNEASEPISTEVVSLDNPSDEETAHPSLLVDAVIEIAKKGRIPDEIDVNAPYFVIYTIRYDEEGKIWREGKFGRNLEAKDLDSFRAAHKKHLELFRKREVMMSTDNCLVYKENDNTIKVTFYHFTEHSGDSVDSKEPKVGSYSNHIPYYATVDLHKIHRRMKRAIEKAKEYSASIGSSSSPYYDKYTFHDNGATVTLNGNPERVTEDESTLVEIKAAFETFARFLSAGTVLISEDDCVAVKMNDNIHLVLFNFPSQAKVSSPAKKKRSKVVKETEPVINEVKVVDSPCASDVVTGDETETDKDVILDAKEQTLVNRAVEFILKRKETQDKPEGTDANIPYYEDYVVYENKDGSIETRTPVKKRMDINSFESFKMASERYCRLYFKDKDMISTADYLAYTQPDNSIVVRLYTSPSDPTSNYETVGEGNNSVVDPDTMKKLRAKMRYAMRKAKKESMAKGEEADKAFYDRYVYYLDNGRNLYSGTNYSRRYDDEATVIELKSAFEDYVKLFFEDPMVISTDVFVAVMEKAHNGDNNKRFHITYFHVPEQKNSGVTPEEQKLSTRDTTVKEESSLVLNDSSSTVNPLILKAVEMTKSLQVGNGTNVNDPYFIQCEFSVVGDGELIQKGKPFSKNVSDEEELVKLRRNHLRFAKTMKAINPVSTENYTAYVWNDGKNLSVFYYNTRGLADAA